MCILNFVRHVVTKFNDLIVNAQGNGEYVVLQESNLKNNVVQPLCNKTRSNRVRDLYFIKTQLDINLSFNSFLKWT
jgi:hypothetical protein